MLMVYSHQYPIFSSGPRLNWNGDGEAGRPGGPEAPTVSRPLDGKKA